MTKGLETKAKGRNKAVIQKEYIIGLQPQPFLFQAKEIQTLILSTQFKIMLTFQMESTKITIIQLFQPMEITTPGNMPPLAISLRAPFQMDLD